MVGIGAIGLIAAAAGTTFWTFIDPSTSGAPFALYIGGIAICYLAVLGSRQGDFVVRSQRLIPDVVAA